MKNLKSYIRDSVLLELARRKFWYFCKALLPQVYREERTWLKGLCDTLDKAPSRLIINMPPRHYKSLTLTLYEAFRLGQDNENRILTVSYNDTIASRFSKGVRNLIEATTTLEEDIVYRDIFPNVRIKKGDGSAQIWAVEGQHFSYLGAGMGASMTGLGATIGIIDDPIKNSKESYTAHILDSHWDFYQNTFLSRIETGGQIIVNHTRWNDNDLAGRLLREGGWEVYSVSAEVEDGIPVDPEIMSPEELAEKKKTMSPAIWQANYNQRIIHCGDSLYESGFDVFYEIPAKGARVAILDVADRGSDFFSCFAFIENGIYYDCFATFMDSTELINLEDRFIKWLKDHHIDLLYVESNSFGNYFAQTLKKQRGSGLKTVIKLFHNKDNKEARIRSASFYIQDRLRFHASLLHSDFYTALSTFNFKKSLHDDVPDVCSNLYHMYAEKNKSIVGKRL